MQDWRQCYAAETSPVDDAVFDNPEIFISASTVDLSVNQVRLDVTVAPDKTINFKSSALRVLVKGGAADNYAIRSIKFVREAPCRPVGVLICPWKQFQNRALEKRQLKIEAVIEVDPAKVQSLVLRMANTVHLKSGRTVPDLEFKRMMFFPPIWVP